MEIAEIEIHNGIQSIKIPGHMKIEDDKVYIKRIGEAIYIIPVNNPWNSLIESLDEFSADFMKDREQGEFETREDIGK